MACSFARRWLTICGYLAAIVLLSLSPSLTRAAEDDDKIIYHGVNWIQFGPGIITRCDVARLRLTSDPFGSELVGDAEKIAQLKRWAFSMLYVRFDVSPKEPIDPAISPVPSVSFYSWRIFLSQPRWDFSTTPPDFIPPMMKIDEALLIYVPVLPEVLGVSKAECDRQVAWLKSLLPAK